MGKVLIVWTVFNRSTSEKCHLMTLGLERAGVNTYSLGFSDTAEQRAYLEEVFQHDKRYIYEHGVKRKLYQGGNYLTKILNNIYMASSFFIRLMSFVIRDEKVSYIILPTQPIEVVLPTILVGKIFRIKIVTNVMEYYPSLPAFKVKKNILIRWSWYLVMKYSDSFIVISDFLYRKINSSSDKRKMILPAILPDSSNDSGFLDSETDSANDKVLLIYTSSPAYDDLLDFTLDSLSLIKDRDFLLVVTGGYKDSMLEKWNKKIHNLGLLGKVDFCGFLSESDLSEIQKKSDALLIPLIDNDRHIARFPQKSLGYMQLGNPIVTTNVGELGRYFKDGETAIMDNSVSIEGFSEKIKLVLDDRALSRDIGQRGKKYVESYFNVNKWGEELKEFLQE